MIISYTTYRGYTAPEYLQREDLPDTVDVFSFGVVVLEIVSGERNVASSSKKELEFLVNRVSKNDRVVLLWFLLYI